MFNCLVSIDRLFNCLSVDGKKKNYNFTSFSGSDVSEVLCISKVYILRDCFYLLCYK